MCLVILVNKEVVDRLLECKRAGREMRRKFAQKILPCFRPTINKDQYGASQQADQHPEDGTPPHYASETSLLLSKEVMK
jgi:hypothetical protein